MVDQMVLATQQWLNQTYGSVNNYTPVIENGQTGWQTIYGLVQGLQHELGISLQAGLPAFGEATAAAFDAQVVPRLENGYQSSFVYLIQGAFWAKGINPGEFNGVYSSETQAAITTLQTEAGFTNPDGVLTALWAKALFDMSAFVLLANGDAKIRSMQQYLNLHYSEQTGILPADGVYQRDTNTALIYGVQVELGLASIANGVWGPATRLAYATAYANGLSASLIRLVQFALYVNMAQYITANQLSTVPFNGQLDTTTQSLLFAFQQFMHLTPVTDEQPDPVTMYSLMVSSGSPSRNFWGIDTSIQLTPAMIQALVNWEVTYVARYLTGSVGSGASQRPKNLTRSEAQAILKANLHLIPIYQDNNPTAAYFTRRQGQKDARAAMAAATELGLPTNTTIYFAIDMDMTDDEITADAVPYFNGITSIFNNGEGANYYVAGVYGTRNVSTRLALESGSVSSYVCNMSTGYSSNLGFSQPLNWAFDQFAEDDSGASGVPAIDYVNVSHEDEGVLALNASVQLSWIFDTEFAPLRSAYLGGSLTWDGPEITLYDNKLLKLTAQLTTSVSSGDSDIQFNISAGQLENGFEASLSTFLGPQVSAKLKGSLADKLEDIAAGIDTGLLKISWPGSGTGVGLSITLINNKSEINGVETSSAIILKASIHLVPLSQQEASNEYQEGNQNIARFGQMSPQEQRGLATLLVFGLAAAAVVVTDGTGYPLILALLDSLLG